MKIELNEEEIKELRTLLKEESELIIHDKYSASHLAQIILETKEQKKFWDIKNYEEKIKPIEKECINYYKNKRKIQKNILKKLK